MSREMLYSVIAFVVLSVGFALGYLAGMPEPGAENYSNPDCYMTWMSGPATREGVRELLVRTRHAERWCAEAMESWHIGPEEYTCECKKVGK